VNATSQEVRGQVVALARTQYASVNHTHLTELLAEREGIGLSRTTIRNILTGAGIPSPRRRRPPRHRQRRERRAQEGMLLQMDGRPHDWLKGRGPASTLLLAVDDATHKQMSSAGTVPAARFHNQEDTLGYLLLFQDIFLHHGIPLAVYTDRHAVFQPSASWTLLLSSNPTARQKQTERRAVCPTSRLPLLSQFITALATEPAKVQSTSLTNSLDASP